MKLPRWSAPKLPRGAALRWTVAVVLASITVAAVALSGDREGVVPEPLTRPVGLEVVESFSAGRAPQAVAVTEDALWVTAAAARRLLRIDPASGERSAAVDFGAVPAGVTVMAGSVWVGFAEGEEILRLDESDPLGAGTPIVVGQTPQWIAPAEDGAGLWVAALNEPAVALVDAATGEVVESIDLEDGFPGAVAAGFGRIWVPDIVTNSLHSLDPEGSGEPVVVRVGSSPTTVAVGEGAVWVGNFDSQTVSHFDPVAGRVVGGTRVGGAVGGITTGLGYVWVTEQENGRLVAIDPATDEVAGAIEVGSVPQGVAVGPDGSIWVVVQGDNAVVRVTVR